MPSGVDPFRLSLGGMLARLVGLVPTQNQRGNRKHENADDENHHRDGNDRIDSGDDLAEVHDVFLYWIDGFFICRPKSVSRRKWCNATKRAATLTKIKRNIEQLKHSMAFERFSDSSIKKKTSQKCHEI